jgi:hypothetical protein
MKKNLSTHTEQLMVGGLQTPNTERLLIYLSAIIKLAI